MSGLPEIGVRISWLIFAKNLLLALIASPSSIESCLASVMYTQNQSNKPENNNNASRYQ
jgi:hypothetical protein